MINEHRHHPRLKHHAGIRITLPDSSKQLLAEMRDFSESGLYLLWLDEFYDLTKGATASVQTTEFEEAPIQTVKIVRIEPGIGIALQFLSD